MNNQSLAEGLCKYLDWNDEMVAARKETAPNDAAGVLCGVLYGGDDASKLIGGSNALVLWDAAKEINRLRSAIRATITENAHLADGDDCTLIRLKQALSR
jgi:hypothetical protein